MSSSLCLCVTNFSSARQNGSQCVSPDIFYIRFTTNSQCFAALSGTDSQPLAALHGKYGSRHQWMSILHHIGRSAVARQGFRRVWAGMYDPLFRILLIDVTLAKALRLDGVLSFGQVHIFACWNLQNDDALSTGSHTVLYISEWSITKRWYIVDWPIILPI